MSHWVVLFGFRVDLYHMLEYCLYGLVVTSTLTSHDTIVFASAGYIILLESRVRHVNDSLNCRSGHSLLLQCQPLMELWTLPGVRFGFCCGTPILRQDVGIER